MLFPWQQRIQSSSTVERSSRMSPFWKLRCPSAVPVWSHSARTALHHKWHRGLASPGTPRTPRISHSGGRELGGTRDLLLRQRWHLRRDLCKEPPDRAVLPSRPQEWEQGRRCEDIRDGTEDMGVRDMWGYRGQGQRGWGREKQPNTVWGGHMPTLLSWTELFRPATAGSQLPYACPKRAAMNPESTQENAKNCPQNVWEKQLIAGGRRLRFPQSQAGGGDPWGCSHGTSGQRCLSLERRVGPPGRV